MPLTPHTKLGQYEVVESIGAGGMGEVYRARDTKLGRDVAIKVLPEEFARDKERLDRFEREARLLAQLNHANIATLHGLEEHDGQQFLVMELVEGETLEERIAQSPLPVDEAIPLFIQIAEGLEAAHEKGIIHRDLKPANIKIGPDGKPKILDFGLAKAFVGDTEAAPDSSQSPTLTKRTALGAIMGTASYMSPEQARGKAVDKRTDIWAFGCCLYEALTGKTVFHGETVTDTITAVVHKEPGWDALPATMPMRLRELLQVCLQKSSRDRLRDIGDARIALESKEHLAAAETGMSSSRRLAAIVFLIVGLAVGWLARAITGPADVEPEVSYLAVGLEPADTLGASWVSSMGSPLSPLARTAFALSPDGRHLVFVGRQGDRQLLFHRSLRESEAHSLAETDDALNPFFSPNGEWVGFWSSGQLRKVPLMGGPAVSICAAEEPVFGASWTNDGEVIFGQRWGGLLVVPDGGGTPRLLTKTDAEATLMGHRLPWVLPDGETLLYTEVQEFQWEDAKIVARSLSTGDQKLLVTGGAHPIYASTGHLVFVKLGVVWAAAFDAERLELRGTPRPIFDGIVQSLASSTFTENSGAAQLALSVSGTLAYVPGEPLTHSGRRLVWVEEDGSTQPLSFDRGVYFFPRIAPDGVRAAISEGDNILVLDLRRGVAQRLPGAGANVGAWSLDGSRVLFNSTGGGQRNLFWQLADGSGPQERLGSSPNAQHAAFALPDGSSFLFIETRPASGADVLMLDTSQLNKEPEALLEETFNEAYPALSPDGRWLAYASDESGRYEVFVRAFPSLEGKLQVSVGGGWMPAWAPSGSELYYLNPYVGGGEQALMTVEVSLTSTLRVETPRELFRGRFQPGYPIRSYDVADDGRFLMVESGETSAPVQSSVHLVLNWVQELERLAATN